MAKSINKHRIEVDAGPRIQKHIFPHVLKAWWFMAIIFIIILILIVILVFTFLSKF